jgi:hypothetical protein
VPASPPAAVDPIGAAAAEGRLPRRLWLLGLATLVLAAWGGIVPYVGPAFGYGATGVSSWTWNLGHSLLALLPGAAGVVGGLLIMASARRPMAGLMSGRLALGGILAAVAGAWFVVGPWAWPVITSSARYFAPASPQRDLADLVGYSLGVGLLLVLFGGVALGESMGRRAAGVVRGRPAAMPAGTVSTAV